MRLEKECKWPDVAADLNTFISHCKTFSTQGRIRNYILSQICYTQDRPVIFSRKILHQNYSGHLISTQNVFKFNFVALMQSLKNNEFMKKYLLPAAWTTLEVAVVGK